MSFFTMSRSILTIIWLTSISLTHTALAVTPQEQPEQYSSTGEQLWHYFTDGTSITVGAGARAISVQVKRIDTQDQGKLIDTDEEALFLSYNLKASYFGTSNFGYSWMFNLSSFELHKQETAPEVIEDLGTRVEGKFAYAVPTFFYNMGDKHNGSHFRAGFGLGLGITQFQGDIVLTESTIPDDRVTISNGPSKLFFAAGLFLEGQIGYFTMRIATAGPSLEYNGYEISVSDTSVMLGVTVPFD